MRRRDAMVRLPAYGALCAAALGGVAFSSAPPRASAQALAHGDLGPVEPALSPPSLWLTLHDAGRVRLADLLRGRVTALQLIFTTCSATCPIQGAVFAQVQRQLLARAQLGRVRLLSVSIDPLNDDAKALAKWRSGFGASPIWIAAAPQPEHADVLPDFLNGRRNGVDRHTAQTYVFDTSGRLVYRLAELAPAADVVMALSETSRRSP